MTVRHVVIEQADGQMCIIPNSVVDGAVIVNMSNPDTVATFVEVEVDYATDIEKARAIIMEILKTEPLVVEAEKTTVLVSMLTANGMLLKFAVYTRDIMESYLACSNVRQRIVSEFKKADIVIPYNTVTIDTPEEPVQPEKK
jgi:small-conductance mechanosensitive channel